MTRLLAILILMLVCAHLSNAPAAATDKEKGVSGTIVINAPQTVVWAQATRVNSEEGDKLVSHNGNQAQLEHKFRTIPIFGTTTVILDATLYPQERIEFAMVKSDRLKALIGKLTLTPVSDTKTKAQLYSYVDPNLPFVPRILINHFCAGRVKSKLHKLKHLAEEAQKDQLKQLKQQKDQQNEQLRQSVTSHAD